MSGVEGAGGQPGPGGERRFPDGFLWGVSTAAYQVEGAVSKDGRGESIWDRFSHAPGRTFHGDTGDVACDQYHRIGEDVELMAELQIPALRFSVAWPRIQPEGRGPASRAGLDHYRRVVDLLRQHGIEPVVTLYHWDLPQPLEDAGGWRSRETALRFADLAEAVAGALSDVGLWVTVNEPWVAAFLGYGTGEHAPGATDLASAVAASHHLLVAHGLATWALRARLGAEARVGISLNLVPAIPASDAPEDLAAAGRLDGLTNRWFLDPLLRGRYPSDVLGRLSAQGAEVPLVEGDEALVAVPLDFLGVNYYTTRTVAAAPVEGSFAGLGVADVDLPGAARTAKNWRIDPEGLTALLCRLSSEYPVPPLYVTENGAAFCDYVDPEGEVRDLERVEYLAGHVRACHEAIARGVDLRGYFVWSLLDNFEWADGYSMRFGLVYVDYGTQRRVPKRSARFYAGVARDNALGVEGAGAGSVSGQ